MNFIDIVMPYILLFLQIILSGLGIVFLISGIDELFIDCVYLIYKAYRKIFISRKYSPLTESQLLSIPEKPIAIMIPCWDESDVIRRMLDNTIKTVTYSNYQIFVGTYPNDPQTQREVALASEVYGNVNRIVCPKDGPTNKADCLNWIYAGIRHYEKEHGVEFAIYVMNDSEDIAHPLYLKLFNYLIPRCDMVQLPVFPMVLRWWNFTAGHYADEFAENHARDMLVREILSKSVPSAGVGSGYSRRALELLAADSNNQLFNIDSLTEDYDFGMRMRKFGLRQIFVRHVLQRQSVRTSWLTGRRHAVTKREYIVIREFFPRTFTMAVRQKSRWIMGIALQGWASIGWQGDFWTRYMLFRDRKGLITNIVSMTANALVPVFLLIWLYFQLMPDVYNYPPIVERDTWLWHLMQVNLFFFFWRSFCRMMYVYVVYGIGEAVLSFPRLIWGNVINFAATMRAFKLYARYLLTGKVIAWDKTDHTYPSEADLMAYRRKLGDLMLDRRFITTSQLDAALAKQKESGRPLGQVLLDMGMTTEDNLVQILGQQFHLETRDIDPFMTPMDALTAIPRQMALANSAFPLEIKPTGELAVAVENPPSQQAITEMEQAAGRAIVLYLVTKSDLAYALRFGFDRITAARESETLQLVQKIKDASLLTNEQIDNAYRQQRKTYARLGDVLIQENMLQYKDLKEAEARYFTTRNSNERFGVFLVINEYITQDQLVQALSLQKSSCASLQDILLQLGYVSQKELDALADKPAASENDHV